MLIGKYLSIKPLTNTSHFISIHNRLRNFIFRESLKDGSYLTQLGIDERIILKKIIGKLVFILYTGFSRFRKQSRERFY